MMDGQLRWFSPWGWVYRPVSVVGWVAVFLVAAFLVHTFIAINARAHSASDTLYGVFPYAVCALVLLYWLASKTSGRAQ